MNMIKKNKSFWLIWVALILVLSIYLANKILQGEDKSVFMPGPLTNGHHQIGLSCDSCHGDSFSGSDSMQKLCIDCHGDQRKKPYDSHPKAKFTDPGNADRLENINALDCTTCHVEHQPSITNENGLTQPIDFCIHCHKDIAKDRPSHNDLPFDTCATSGCHNYHNNRSLYTDYLIKHLDETELLSNQRLPEKEFSKILDEVIEYPHKRYPVKQLTLEDIDAPDNSPSNNQLHDDWLTTAHAQSGVNCSGCHLPASKENDNSQWIDKPDHTACATCHGMEVEHFMKGKHGMRIKQDLPPMTPSLARLPMKAKSEHTELNCNTCHKAHKYELTKASVDICLDCHNDKHSIAYTASPHFYLLDKEQNGNLPAGSGVSCASCHMPRLNYDVSEWLRRIMVQHNQNENLRPNSKMIRSVCTNCHGLEFTIDSLADKNLVDNNFNGKPKIHIDTMDLAKKELQRRNSSRKSD